MLRKVFKHFNNGVILILLGILHTNLAFSDNGFGNILSTFQKSNYFQISKGMDELPAQIGITNFETFAAFWFFYFGLLIIPLGILLYSVEKEIKNIPHSFTISYIIFVLIGCYMIPNSGMTYLMLPHATFMLIYNFFRTRRLKLENAF